MSQIHQAIADSFRGVPPVRACRLAHILAPDRAPVPPAASPALLAPSLALDYIGSAIADAREALDTGDTAAVHEALDDIENMKGQLALDHAHRVTTRA